MKKTPLNAIHRALGARMVEFGGWDMPVQYSGVISEHIAVRQAAGLFDVSHMGEIEVAGPEAFAFLQAAMTNDLSRLKDGQVQYTAMCYENGGVVDDLTLYRFAEDRYLLCVNAANAEKDFSWLQKLQGLLQFNHVNVADKSRDFAQLALQGPAADRILETLTSVDLGALKYYHFVQGQVASIDTMISRTGYTGEAGFELYCPADEVVELWQRLMQSGAEFGLQPVGLGARDTLRLEKGFALYGHEISADILPLEARLGWITKLDKGDFIGREALVRAKQEGLSRTLISLRLTEAGVPREKYPVYHGERQVGYVTSGTMSPSLKQGIALALVDAEIATADLPLAIGIRNRMVAAERVVLPFV